jgi:exopolysaccharide biosynthesis protein
VAVVQTGPLEYAIVEAYGKTDGSMGMTIQEFADYIAYLFPDCVMAYNLDGGGSTNVVLKGERIHTTPGHRQISDILYFASAWREG